jgi:hypothetical protein
VIPQKEVLIYFSHRSWHCRRTSPHLSPRSCDCGVIDTTGTADYALG